jgi:hypothetical protein
MVAPGQVRIRSNREPWDPSEHSPGFRRKVIRDKPISLVNPQISTGLGKNRLGGKRGFRIDPFELARDGDEIRYGRRLLPNKNGMIANAVVGFWTDWFDGRLTARQCWLE